MPLTQLSLSAKIAWALSGTNGNFGPSKQGPDSESFSLLSPDLTVWTQLFAANYVLFVAAPTGLTPALATGGTLTVGQEYFYVVTATANVTNSAETSASSEVSATPTTGNQSVKLTWTQTPGATGYKVYRGTTAGSENVLIATIASGSTLTFTDTGTAGSSGSPPSAMPDNFIEFALDSFTNLITETVTPGHAFAIILLPSGVNAQCLLEPGASNGLTWFFRGTDPGLDIPVTASSGNGGVFLLSAPEDHDGQIIDSTHNTLRITNGGTGNLTVTVLVITGP